MLVSDRFHRLQFNDQATFNEQVRKVLTQDRSILVVNRERELLFDFQTLLLQPVHQRVLVDLFKVAISVVLVDRETGLANDVAQLGDVFPCHV